MDKTIEKKLERIKDKTLYVNLIAKFKDNETIAILLEDRKNKRYREEMMKYSEYCKLDLKYGVINKSAFDRISRRIYYGRITANDIRTNEEVIRGYREYLLELKEKREFTLSEAKRKVRECEDILELIDNI